MGMKHDQEEEIEQPAAPLPPITASPIPQVEVLPPAILAEDNNLTDDMFTGGTYNKRSTGQPFALCVHAEDQYGNTHSLKNSVHFWQGTAAQFAADFEKV